jgi:hypothetical protein
MGGGFTVTNSYDGPTSAAAGDTFVTFTETLVTLNPNLVNNQRIVRQAVKRSFYW